MTTEKSYPSWECTDPDEYQYRFDNKDGSYTFKQFNSLDYRINTEDYQDAETFIDTVWDNATFWHEKTINLADYTTEQINDYVSAYDYLPKYAHTPHREWFDATGEPVADEIIAECIFESIIG